MDVSSISVAAMTEESPIRELIDRWPTRREMADDVGSKEAAVHKWARAGRIPSQRQAAVVEAARRRGFDDVTAEWMLLAHARREEGGPLMVGSEDGEARAA